MKCGFPHRTLVGIGHSFGGASLYESSRSSLRQRDAHSMLSRALAAINKPILFSSLVLVDPVILPPPPLGKFESWAESFGYLPTLKGLLNSGLTRRSAWKSKFVVLSRWLRHWKSTQWRIQDACAGSSQEDTLVRCMGSTRAGDLRRLPDLREQECRGSEIEGSGNLGVSCHQCNRDETKVSLNVLHRRLPPSWRYVYHLKSGIG